MFELFSGNSIESHSTRTSTTYLFKFFQIMGINSPRKWKLLYYLYASIVILCVDIGLVLTFSLSFILLFDRMSTSQFLTSLQVAINAFGLPNKVLTLKFYMKHLREAEDIMDILDKSCQKTEEFAKLKKCTMICNRLTVFYAFIYVFYSVVSFVSSVIMGQPPYSLYLHPLDWRNSKWEFMLQSLIEFILMNLACLQQSMCDCYGNIYVYILRTHMQLLVERVRSLGTMETKTQEKNYQELVKSVKDHQNLISLHNTISPIISVTLFIQFLLTAAIIGTTMINILIFAERSAQIASVVYLLGVFIQTSPICYQATCLLDDGEQLSLAILQCRWWEQDKRFRKVLLFFMQNAQKPPYLWAMKLFPINLNTNLSIVKFSFSLYTFIKNVDFGKN